MSQTASLPYAWSLAFGQAKIVREEAFLHPQDSDDTVVLKPPGYQPPAAELAQPFESRVRVGWTAPEKKGRFISVFKKPRSVPLVLPWAEVARGGVALASPSDTLLSFGCLLAARTLECGIPAVVLRYDQVACADALADEVHVHFRSRIRGLNLGLGPMKLPKPVRMAQLDLAALLETPEDLADLMSTATSGSPVEQAMLRGVYYALAAAVWPSVKLAIARQDWERLLTVLEFGFSLQGLGAMALLAYPNPESKLALSFLGTRLQGDVVRPETLAIHLTKDEATAAESKLSGVHGLLAYLRTSFRSGAFALGEGVTPAGLLAHAWLTCVGLAAPPPHAALLPTQQWLITRLLAQAQRIRATLPEPLQRPWLVALAGHSRLQNFSAVHALEDLIGVFEGGRSSGLWHDLRPADIGGGVTRDAVDLAIGRSPTLVAVGARVHWTRDCQPLIGAPASVGARPGLARFAWLDLARGRPGELAKGWDGWITLQAPSEDDKPA